MGATRLGASLPEVGNKEASDTLCFFKKSGNGNCPKQVESVR